MGIAVLNENFEQLYYIDTYESLIWTLRFAEAGDFELYSNASSEMASMIKKGYYLLNSYGRYETDNDFHFAEETNVRGMIVEGIKTETKSDTGKKMIFTGRSFESILDRRIVWGQRNLTGNVQACVKSLINENVINPSVQARKIPNFIFEDTDDIRITTASIDTQYTGDNLLEAVEDLCSMADCGFKVVLNEKNQFVMSLYAGTDRSFSEDRENYVKFSPGFDNLFSSEFYENNQTFKNYALIGGEGEGTDRRYVAMGSEDSGLNRRELFVDARDVQSSTSNGETEVTMSDDQYNELLFDRGRSELLVNVVDRAFEGEIDPERSFELNKDYFLGDIIQLSDDLGHDVAARILELIYSESTAGVSFYPTFAVLNETISSVDDITGGETDFSGHGSSYLRPRDIWAITFPEIDDIVI